MSNPWNNPDALPPATVADLAQFIDARADLPDQQRAHAALVAALDPQPGAQLLDLGCGTGPLTRRLLPIVGPAGLVVGCDISHAMLSVARARGPDTANLRYDHQPDPLRLPYPAAQFAGALAARVLMHVDDPIALAREVLRVVRPGGRLAVLDFDWGTLALDHSDRALTRRILDWRTDYVDGNNWGGRQNAAHLLRAGWIVREVVVQVAVARDARGTLAGGVRRAAQLAAAAAVISADQQNAWTAEIDARLAEGVFFASINEYIIVGERATDG